MWGKVRRVEPYGVFVTIDGTRFSGLLHISSISQAHVEAVEVRCRLWLPSPCRACQSLPLCETCTSFRT